MLVFYTINLLKKHFLTELLLSLPSNEMSMVVVREIVEEAYLKSPDLIDAARADLSAVYDRDPSCHRLVQPILYFKGYQAVQSYRVAHFLWIEGHKDLASFFQMRVSEIFGVDIHPAATIGKGIMIDHGTFYCNRWKLLWWGTTYRCCIL